MNSKLKKWILSIAIVLVVGIVAGVAFTMLSRVSAATIYNLQFVEPLQEGEDEQTRQEIFEKTVNMTAEQDNFFKVELLSSSSSLLDYRVYSTDEEVAKVEREENDIYIVRYYKAGQTNIVAEPEGGKDVKESFVLNVQNNLPTLVTINDEENPNVVEENKVRVFGDELEYAFNLNLSRGDIVDQLNCSSIRVVDNYNKDIFESISIDPSEKQLLIKAKYSINNYNEIVSLQVVLDGEEDRVVSMTNVFVSVEGYNIANIQLVLSQTSDFLDESNIYGKGLVFEGENSVDVVKMTTDINTLYAHVRVVYTNGTYEDVTSQTSTRVQLGGGNAVRKVSEQYGGDYFILNVSQETVITFYVVNREIEKGFSIPASQQDFQFFFLGNDAAYKEFMDKQLYRYVTDEDGNSYYEYIYWDTRFQREDVITKDGKIIDFIGTPPDCKEE